MFDDILERNKVFLDSKIIKLKKSQICYFSKGVSPCLDQKLENLPSFYYWQNQLAKCV